MKGHVYTKTTTSTTLLMLLGPGSLGAAGELAQHQLEGHGGCVHEPLKHLAQHRQLRLLVLQVGLLHPKLLEYLPHCLHQS